MQQIEIRCNRKYCNKLLMIYKIEGKDKVVPIKNLEIKCNKCKRVIRTKNYYENDLILKSNGGVLLI